jgi:hypothetical protein
MKALRKVGRQFAQLRRDLKTAIKEINSDAAKKVAQGNYGASQEMVALAKAVQQFTTDAKDFNERWKAIAKQQKKGPRAETTPVWEYYRLVARAIVSLGGECNFEEIVDWMKKNAMSDLKPGDILEGPKGLPVWQRALSKTKRPMVKEGFLEQAAGKWKVTKSGRNLVSQSS